jgi:glycolate oxidase iron-sulfur subunit
VDYGLLITSARQLQKSGQRAPGIIDRALLHTLSHAPYSKSISSLTGIYQKLGLTSITSRLGGKTTERLNQLLPAKIDTASWRESYPAIGSPLGRIGLFTGCISRIADRAALNAAIGILNRMGYEVVVPFKQGCCGAMHLSSGDSKEAEAMAQRNRTAFSQLELDAIVGVATGCVSHLTEHSGLSETSAPVMDISVFLSTRPALSELKLAPLNKRVAIHTPCSMKNVLKQGDAPFTLLQHIPEINLIELPEDGLCCGAAGLYLIANPDEADGLRKNKIDALKNCQAEILLTSNTGCSLHLAAGVRAADMDVELMHPVELLARQIAD